MTTISAKIIADSYFNYQAFGSPVAKRITTMQLRYPRFIHAEFMTHRQFSRNASSSRAVPVSRLIDDMCKDPVVPLYWGKNQKGMQASEECNELVKIFTPGVPYTRVEAWIRAMNRAIETARAFDEAGYHKQVVNRLLEPFSHINVLVTSTEWSNFFALRLHKDAEPHMQLLAHEMEKNIVESRPELLRGGQWHLPYVTEHDRQVFGIDSCKNISVARCARVSYLTHDNKPPEMGADIALAKKLLANVPLHASPAEHQATPDTDGSDERLWGNFSYWIQNRKTLAGECQ